MALQNPPKQARPLHDCGTPLRVRRGAVILDCGEQLDTFEDPTFINYTVNMKKELSEEVSDIVVEVVKTPFKIVSKTFDWMTDWM